jgi:hypothetical protein
MRQPIGIPSIAGPILPGIDHPVVVSGLGLFLVCAPNGSWSVRLKAHFGGFSPKPRVGASRGIRSLISVRRRGPRILESLETTGGSTRGDPRVASYRPSSRLVPTLESPRTDPRVASYRPSSRLVPTLESPRTDPRVASYRPSSRLVPTLESPRTDPRVASYRPSSRIVPTLESLRTDPRVDRSDPHDARRPRSQRPSSPHALTLWSIAATRESTRVDPLVYPRRPALPSKGIQLRVEGAKHLTPSSIFSRGGFGEGAEPPGRRKRRRERSDRQARKGGFGGRSPPK